MSQHITVSLSSGVGRLTLDRPDRLNALTLDMVQGMTDALLQWVDRDDVDFVVIDHNRERRGFCAGGDVKALAGFAKTDPHLADVFFYSEYRLNHLLFTYPKPVVSIMDGVTMGGGAGIALPAGIRIVTQNTTFAMPEVHTGLFPDVGGTWHLTRKSVPIGMWLGLTGQRVSGQDCVRLGLATDFIQGADVPSVVEAMTNTPRVGATAPSLAYDNPGVPESLLDDDMVEGIMRCYASDSVESIVQALADERAPWAYEHLERIMSASPLSLKVTFEALRRASTLASFEEALVQEYRLATRFVRHQDFAEAVDARLISRDREPEWRPETLSAVSDAHVEAMFAPVDTGDEWAPIARSHVLTS